MKAITELEAPNRNLSLSLWAHLFSVYYPEGSRPQSMAMGVELKKLLDSSRHFFVYCYIIAQ